MKEDGKSGKKREEKGDRKTKEGEAKQKKKSTDAVAPSVAETKVPK